MTTIATSFVAAYVVSLPFQFPIAGFGFGGRASVFCLIFGIGYVISSRRIRMLPVELQALYLIRSRGIGKLKASLRNPFSPSKNRSSSQPKPSQVRLKMLVEDFRDPTPLVVSDRLNGVSDGTKVLLLFDGEVRTEESISPSNLHYRLVYSPLPRDIGEHALTVNLVGTSQPLTTISLSLVGRSQGVGSSITKGE